MISKPPDYVCLLTCNKQSEKRRKEKADSQCWNAQVYLPPVQRLPREKFVISTGESRGSVTTLLVYSVAIYCDTVYHGACVVKECQYTVPIFVG